jgi:hypothetical protein
MQADFTKISQQSEDEMRTVRLARGLRAVAASVIVGGIVIAAFEADPTAVDSTSRGAGGDAEENFATGVPPVSPTQASPLSAPASREIEPVLERIERSMEHHGQTDSCEGCKPLSRST